MKLLPDLASAPDAIARRGGTLGRPLHVLDVTASTNDDAKASARAGAPHGSTWVTETQTAGRGRQGRTWLSPPGENLLFSVLLRVPSAVPERLPLVSLVAGLAVARVVARAAPRARVAIKWPNDVVILASASEPLAGFAKIAGVLVESTMTRDRIDGVVVGVGLNVHTRAFPEPIAATATSLALVTEEPPGRGELLADALHELDRDVAIVLARGLGPLHRELTTRDALLGRRVRAEDVGGIARGIDVDGRLVVETDEGPRVALSAGEVHLGLA